ncbi:MAG: hypothetical protein WC889_13925 [Myxococcota bacterium]|jgi:pimeloyl-ACP methyl ester carboxylesterase
MSSLNPAGGKPSPSVIESREVTAEGTAYDLYEPAQKAGRTVITVHGMTSRGARDSRLVRFSRALAHEKVRVAAIQLPAVASFRFDPGDVRAMQDVIGALGSRHGTRVGIIPFSFGAGISLVAASEKDTRDQVEAVLSFGAYYSLEETLRLIHQRYRGIPTTEEEWDNHLYMHFAMASSLGEKSGMSRDDLRTIDGFLESYCEATDFGPMKTFYLRSMAGLDLSDKCERSVPPEDLKAMSPEGRMGSMNCRVLLLHDSADPLIPPNSSQRIFKELEAARGGGMQKILVTPLLSHVQTGSIFHLADMPGLLSFFGEFVG